jgi:hypothetical protein
VLASTELRILIIIAAAALAAHYPMAVDQWLWRGVRDIFGVGSGTPAVCAGAAMVAAECLGRWLPAWRPRLRRAALSALLIAVLAGVAFWIGRVPAWLGDYNGIDNEPPKYVGVEPAEPLYCATSSF